MFTEKGFTSEHKENIENILTSVNRKTLDDIVTNRSHLSKVSWEKVHDYGSITAQLAKEMGFVDYLVDRDPLEDLLDAVSSKDAENQRTITSKLADQTNFEDFKANKMISFKDYAQLVARRKRTEARKWNSYQQFKYMAENSSAAQALLSMLGYKAPYYNMKQNVSCCNEKCR